MLKTFISIIIMVILFASFGCSPSATTNSHNQSNSLAFNETNKQIQFKDIVTNKNYKLNDQIEIGNNSDIIVKQGVWQNPIYWRSNVNILGADSQGNIITFNIENSNVESIDSDQKLSVLMNLTEGRPNHVFAIKKSGDIVAWSECPHGNIDPASDATRGANWGLYYTDLKTKKISKIDEYKGVTVPEGTQYSYLAPNQVFIAPDHISYITFDYNPEGKVTSVIKLYTISTHKLEVLDYLNEDLTKYAFGYPRVSGDKVVWCKALVNPDGTYTGCSYLYDMKTKTRSKLVTDENIINPIISGNYIFAQGEPNKTFYDSEVCIYDIDKNQWVYKINNGYSQYKADHDVDLNYFDMNGKYLLWKTGVMRALVLFNQKDNKLYNIVSRSEDKEITSPMLLDGGLLIWFEKPWGAGNTKPVYHYLFLK